MQTRIVGRVARWIGVTGVTLACGCGGSDQAATSAPGGQGAGGAGGVGGTGGAAGGGVGGGGAGGAATLSPPPPMPPVFTPCPMGWSETKQVSGITTCAPGPLPDWACPPGWAPTPYGTGGALAVKACAPPDVPATCPAGTMPVLGKSDCEPIGDPCPAGDFPTGVPASAKVTYVKAGAPAGGTGTMQAPYATIAAAITGTPKGGVVAVAKGMYAEDLSAGKDITLWGTCVTDVVIVGSAAAFPKAAISVGPGTVVVKNVTVTGGRVGVVAAGTSTTLSLSGVRVSKATAAGLLVGLSAQVTLDHVSIEDVQAAPSSVFGRAIEVQQAGKLTAAFLHVEHALETAINTQNKGHVELTDSIVRNTQSETKTKTGGSAVQVAGGMTFSATRVLFDQNRDFGLIAMDTGTTVTLTDVVVRRTDSAANGASGTAVGAGSGAQVTVTRALFDHNHTSGFGLLGAGTTLTATDVVVANTLPQVADGQAVGMAVGMGAQATITRGLFDQNQGAGVSVNDAGTAVTLNDVAVTRTLPLDDGTAGGAIGAVGGSQLTANHVFIDHARNLAAFADGDGTVLTLSDVVLSNTESQKSSQRFGRGLNAQNNAHVVAARVVVDHNLDTGVFLATGASATLTDILVQNTQGDESDQTFGRGVSVQQGATLDGTRIVLDGNQETALAAVSMGTSVTLTDVTIQNTGVEMSTQEYGIGLYAEGGASVSLTRAVLRQNQVAAALLQQGAHVDLTSCVLDATKAGAFTPALPGGMLASMPVTGVGDGLVALSGSTVTMGETLVSGCSRAGLLFDGAGGTLTHVVSTKNVFGVVLQNGAMPTYDATSSFGDNTKQGVLMGGSLPVPNAPLPVPDPGG